MLLEVGGYYRPINQKAFGSNVLMIRRLFLNNNFCDTVVYDKNGQYKYEANHGLTFLRNHCIRVKPSRGLTYKPKNGI